MGHQGLCIAQVVGDIHEAQIAQDIEGSWLAAFNLKSHHGAAAFHLFAGQNCLWMAIEERINHPRNTLGSREMFGHGQGGS